MKEHVWIPSRGKRLSSIVHSVENAQGLVVLCHGFTGDKTGANQLLRSISEALESHGFSSVRFDFAGSGESEGVFAVDTTISGWNTDLQNVLEWVRNQPEFIKLPIFILGHSLGGCVVLLCGSEHVSGRIALAPVVHPLENLREQIIGPTLWKQSMEGKQISCFYGKGFSLEPNFVADVMQHSFTPIEQAKHYAEPLLVIHGTGDAAVPYAGSLQLKEEYKHDAELVLFDHVDHVFTGNLTRVQTSIVQWLQEKIKFS